MESSNCASQFITENADPLCTGLLQLKKEHIPLTKQMEAIYAFTQCIENGEVSPNYNTLQDLYNHVQDFVAKLEPHSEREEEVLFEMVAAYIGRTNCPIAVMEYEHERAKTLLRRFLFSVKQSKESITPKEVKEIASYAANAYLILSDHFLKEETVLFPLANQLLTSLEKAILEERISNI